MENVFLPAFCPNCTIPRAEPGQRGWLELRRSRAKDSRIGPAVQDLRDRRFVIARRNVYKSPSGVGPRCLSLSRGHSPALPSPTLKGTHSKRPWLGLNPTVLYKQKARDGVGVLSAGRASLLLRHPGGPLRPPLSTPQGSSRGSLGLLAPAPSPNGARIRQLLVGFALLLPVSPSGTSHIAVYKAVRRNLGRIRPRLP